MKKDKAMGNLGYERYVQDFYETPEWCTDILLNMEQYTIDKFSANVCWIEPACGKGAIANKLIDFGLYVKSFDVVDRGYGEVKDFFEWEPDNYCGIITNPPYGRLAEKFVRHALSFDKVLYAAFLLRNEWDCARGRVDLFKDRRFYKKIVLTKRPKWIKNSDGSPRHNFSWFIWRKSIVANYPVIDYGVVND